MTAANGATALVFTPSPTLTVTIEAGADGDADIHLHPGGQGVWIARMMAGLGVQVHLCAPFGGEAGDVLLSLLQPAGTVLHSSAATGTNGAYVHDRRNGARQEIAAMRPSTIRRHELDELVNSTLAAAFDSDVAVLGGPDHDGIVDPQVYRHLAEDLRAHCRSVVVDLAGAYLTAALAGGATVAKVSHEDLIASGRANSDRVEDLLAAMEAIHDEGAEVVIVSRAGDPALARTPDGVVEIRVPAFTVRDHRGAGDSMTAGIAAAVGAGRDLMDALRLGGAAGALNVTRHGLGSGPGHLIEQIAERVEVRPI